MLPADQMFKHDRTLCRRCYNDLQLIRAKVREERFKAESAEKFNAWLDKVKQVPKDYPSLTEAQWLEACRYFNGCARCASEDIDTRGFFISRTLGGRYCDWNVIPVCEHCAKIWRLDTNVFTYTRNKEKSRRFQNPTYKGASDSPTEYRDSLENIIKYLGVKLDNAIKFTGNTAGYTEGPERYDNAHHSS